MICFSTAFAVKGQLKMFLLLKKKNKQRKKHDLLQVGLNTSPESRVLQGNNSVKLIMYTNVSLDLIPVLQVFVINGVE